MHYPWVRRLRPVDNVGRAGDRPTDVCAVVDSPPGGVLEPGGFRTAVVPDIAEGRWRLVTPVQVDRAVPASTGMDIHRLVRSQHEPREPVYVTCLVTQRPVGHRDRPGCRVGQLHPLTVQLGSG